MAARDAGESLFKVVDTIVNKRLNDSQFDKTIKATIVSCLDQTIGKYKVRYQDGYWYAFSQNIDVHYPNGSMVYITVPNGNFKQVKHITGSVEKNGINATSIEDNGDVVSQSGYNVIEEINESEIDSETGELGFCSYKNGVYELENSLQALKSHIQDLKGDNTIQISADFRTSLPSEHIDNNGDYGIELLLEFYKAGYQGNVDNNSETVIIPYVLNTSAFTGDPYILKTSTNQKIDITIDSNNLKDVVGFNFFIDGFIGQTEEYVNDIFVKNISISSNHTLSDQEKNGVLVRLETPNGVYFGETSAADAVRQLKTNVYINGKEINQQEQNLKFYWFRLNPSVTVSSPLYSKYGGVGWQCLNSAISRENESKDYNPGGGTYDVQRSSVQFSYQTVFKCVVVYQRGQYSSNQIVIKNDTANYEVKIDTDKGTEFSVGQGYPTLTCIVRNPKTHETIEGNFIYYWSVEDYQKKNSSLNQMNDEFNRLEKINSLIDDLQADQTLYQNYQLPSDYKIRYEEIIPDPASSLSQALRLLNQEKEKLEKTQIVKNNKIYHVDINKIINHSTFKCGVYSAAGDGTSPQDFIGAAALQIINKSSPQVGYSLIITNGTQVFKYNEAGISPVSSSLELDKKYEISPLSFELFDKNGNQIEESVAKCCKIKWKIPNSNSLLKLGDIKEGIVSNDPLNQFIIVEGAFELPYTIEDNYNLSNDRNDIKLEVIYQGFTLTGQTNFTFLKTGQNGTNGTQFVCKIEPNTNEQPYYPTIYLGQDYKINETNWGNKLVYSRLYKDGSQIEQGVSYLFYLLKTGYDGQTAGGPGLEMEEASVTVDNKQYRTLSFNSQGKVLNDGDVRKAVDIIQTECRYNDKKYYATLPIVISKGNENYRINIKPYTGFKFAIYNSDGSQPNYDNRLPFEVVVEQKIGDSIWEDVSRLKVKQNDILVNKISYEWMKIGNVVDAGAGDVSCQHWFKPIDIFNNSDTCNGVYCKAKIGQDVIGQIYIPISFYLNRYGQSYLNDWDGNSISINENDGVILSPLVGAGQKNNQNQFTGVLMGKVQESSQEQIGLFGYNKGGRTIFLDAESGKAEFGKQGQSRIVLDPDQKISGAPAALLYSGGYDVNKYVKYPDLPNMIYQRNQDGSIKKDDQGNSVLQPTDKLKGMIIDLSTPQMGFGSGHFYITSEGNIHAKDGGDIAGWQIGADSIHKDTATTHVGMRSGTNNDIVVNVPSGSGTVDKARAFYAGANNNFYVTHDGYLRANVATIGDGSSLIYIGKSDNTNSAIFTLGKNSKTANSSGFYVGTDGIGLGGISNYDANHSKFQVDSDGKVWMTEGYIGRDDNYGLHLLENKIYTNGKSQFRTNADGIYLSSNGIALGGITNEITIDDNEHPSKFEVNNSGRMVATSGLIGGWNISATALSNKDIYGKGISMDSAGTISGEGQYSWSINGNGEAVFTHLIASVGGQIGNWKISKDGLYTGNTFDDSNGIKIGSGGTIKAGNNNWSITSSGKATFKDVNITSTQGTTSTIGGGTAISPTGTTIGTANSSLGTFGQYVADGAAGLADSIGNILCTSKFYAGGKVASSAKVGTDGKITWTDPTAITSYSFYAVNNKVALGVDLDCAGHKLSNFGGVSFTSGAYHTPHTNGQFQFKKIQVNGGIITGLSDVKAADLPEHTHEYAAKAADGRYYPSLPIGTTLQNYIKSFIKD